MNSSSSWSPARKRLVFILSFLAVTVLLRGILSAQWFLDLQNSWHNSLKGSISPFAGHALLWLSSFVFGVVVGVGQWLVLRLWVPKVWSWIPAVALGEAIRSNSWMVVEANFFPSVSGPLEPAYRLLTASAATLILGLLLWGAVRRSLPGAAWLIPAYLVNSIVLRGLWMRFPDTLSQWPYLVPTLLANILPALTLAFLVVRPSPLSVGVLPSTVTLRPHKRPASLAIICAVWVLWSALVAALALVAGLTENMRTLVLFPFVAISLLVGIGLWRCNSIAWHAAQVLWMIGIILSLLGGFIGSPRNFLGIFIPVLLILYLHRPAVKQAFRIGPVEGNASFDPSPSLSSSAPPSAV